MFSLIFYFIKPCFLKFYIQQTNKSEYTIYGWALVFNFIIAGWSPEQLFDKYEQERCLYDEPFPRLVDTVDNLVDQQLLTQEDALKFEDWHLFCRAAWCKGLKNSHTRGVFDFLQRVTDSNAQPDQAIKDEFEASISSDRPPDTLGGYNLYVYVHLSH